MKTNQRHLQQFEVLGFALIIINSLIFLYFIFKLNEIETLTRETQAQAQEIIRTIYKQD